MDEEKKLDRSEFIAFFMLYAAHVDIEYLDSEKALIKQKLSSDKYEEIYNLFLSLSDYETLQLIIRHKEDYFPDEQQKQNLLEEIKKVFFIDGDFSVMEKGLLNFLNRIL